MVGVGFEVNTRWGPKLHKPGCTCPICKSRQSVLAGSGSEQSLTVELDAPGASKPSSLKRKAEDAVREDASTAEPARHGNQTLPEAQPNITRPEPLANGKNAKEGMAPLQPESTTERYGSHGGQQNGVVVPNGAASQAQAPSNKAFSDLLQKAKRGRRELAALGPVSTSASEGRPSHRSSAPSSLKVTLADTAASSQPATSLQGPFLRDRPEQNGAPSPTQSSRKRRFEDSTLASDDVDLTLSPGSKKRRTTVGRPQTSRANGLLPFSGDDSGVEEEEVSGDLEEVKARLVQHFSPDGKTATERILLLQLLKSGVLKGQAVHHSLTPDDEADLTGRVTRDGKIACDCQDCEGAAVSLSDFEEHSGSWDRQPAESTHLSALGTSLKDLCAAVNEACGIQAGQNDTLQRPPQRERQCEVCQQSGRGLLRCGGGCKMRAHSACVGMDKHYQGPWTCLACVEVRARKELEAGETKVGRKVKEGKLHASKMDGRRSSSRLEKFETPKPEKRKPGRPPIGSAPRGSGSKPGRVHMSAPTAKVGLSAGRMARNSNKHKRLFDPDEPNGVKDGEPVVYQTSQGEKLLEGIVRITRGGVSGIECACCDTVISCSQFEAHAGRGSRRAPYDNIYTTAGISLRRLAAELPSEVFFSSAVEDDGDPVQEDMMGGCVLCEEKNFQREGLSDLTVILCDQCEREFHIGCLRECKGIHLDHIPEDDWFCSEKCKDIKSKLRVAVAEGQLPLTRGDDEFTWQLLNGKDQTHGTTWALKAAYDLLQESFDPIIDGVTGQDLLHGMVFARKQGEWDHTGMFTAVLRHKKQPVCALVMRAFGECLAEVPLIATKPAARRKGFAKVLLDALSVLLARLGVKTLSLPAAHATVQTWTEGFGFKPMAADQLLEVRESLRLLVFPGTEILHKPLIRGTTPGFSDQQPRRRKAEAEADPDAGNDAVGGSRAGSEAKDVAEDREGGAQDQQEAAADGKAVVDEDEGAAGEDRAAEGADGAEEARLVSGEATEGAGDALELPSTEPMDVETAEAADAAADDGDKQGRSEQVGGLESSKGEPEAHHAASPALMKAAAAIMLESKDTPAEDDGALQEPALEEGVPERETISRPGSAGKENSSEGSGHKQPSGESPDAKAASGTPAADAPGSKDSGGAEFTNVAHVGGRGTNERSSPGADGLLALSGYGSDRDPTPAES